MRGLRYKIFGIVGEHSSTDIRDAMEGKKRNNVSQTADLKKVKAKNSVGNLKSEG